MDCRKFLCVVPQMCQEMLIWSSQMSVLQLETEKFQDTVSMLRTCLILKVGVGGCKIMTQSITHTVGVHSGGV